MPKYFLDLELGPECMLDVTGCYAADDATFLRILQEVLSEFRQTAGLVPEARVSWVLSISDQAGRLVAKVPI